MERSRWPHVGSRASRGPVAATTGWVGVVLIAASMVAIEPMTSYPGIAATVPTLGTLALIAGGMTFMSPGRTLLASAPLRSIGRISYSLYLWHWPVLVLGAMALAPVDAETGDATAPIWLRLTLSGSRSCWRPSRGASSRNHSGPAGCRVAAAGMPSRWRSPPC